ncbi:hypothetical protein ACJX0J_015558 [Zea mays]
MELAFQYLRFSIFVSGHDFRDVKAQFKRQGKNSFDDSFTSSMLIFFEFQLIIYGAFYFLAWHFTESSLGPLISISTSNITMINQKYEFEQINKWLENDMV